MTSDNTTNAPEMVTQAEFDTDQQRRREELLKHISTFCDHITLPGEDGDAAYDLLREAAARIGSDRLRFARHQQQSASPSGLVTEKFEAQMVSGGMPTDCCDYGVVSLAKGIEVCRVWREDDARLIAELLNRAALTQSPPPNDAVREALEPVWHWYQSDEHPERPLAEIVADVVADLQQDRAWVLNPPKHKFWMPGEPDCPREIKAGNGELHTLRCKVCGQDSPREEYCRAALNPNTESGRLNSPGAPA